MWSACNWIIILSGASLFDWHVSKFSHVVLSHSRGWNLPRLLCICSYAITCIPIPDRPYVSHQCICKPGYSGARCEICSPGYFGDPMSMTACQPCDCDMAGALSPNCAQDTGQCRCAPGVHGRRCDQCEPDHVVDAGRCIGKLIVFGSFIVIICTLHPTSDACIDL